MDYRPILNDIVHMNQLENLVANLYNNFTFNIKIIAEKYPINPPEIYFKQIPYHLNIDQQSGKVILSILE
jgi:ubiquitin-protein ligase